MNVLLSLLQINQEVALCRAPGEVGRKSLSEENENFLDVSINVLDFLTDDVESNGLGEGSALADGNDITVLDSESGRAMGGDGLMALLKSVVLLDVMEVIAANDNSVLHLSGENDTPN